MRTYSRKPALCVLLLTTLLGAAYVLAAHHRSVRGDSLESLERTIAATAESDVPSATWIAYGQKLAQAGRFPQAAAAFRHALERGQEDRAAQLGLVSALAGANDADGLYTTLRDLVYAEPKLATELLARPECRPFLREDRFTTLQKEARVQEMD